MHFVGHKSEQKSSKMLYSPWKLLKAPLAGNLALDNAQEQCVHLDAAKPVATSTFYGLLVL